MIKVAVLNDTTREVGHLGCSLVVDNIIKQCAKNDMTVIYRERTIDNYFVWDDFRQAILFCDLVLVNGEGTLHHDAALGVYIRCEIAREMGKKIFLINSVWEKNSYFSRYIDIFDMIFVRESFSLEELKRDGCVSAMVVPDMVFSHEISKGIVRSNEGLILDSVLDDVALYLAKLAILNGDAFYFMGDGHKRQFLRSHPWYSALLSIRNVRNKAVLDDADLIGKCSYLLSGRYHGVCLALLHGTPFVAMASNSHKIQGLLSDCGVDMKSHLIERDFLNKENLLSAVDFLKSGGDREYRECAADFVSSARFKISEMFAIIKGFF